MPDHTGVGGVAKGKLLYQEEWASKQRFKDRKDILMGYFIAGMGVVLIIMGAYLSIPWNSKGSLAIGMLGGIGAVVIVMGYAQMAREYKRMPLRIYENGFSLPQVPVKQGFRREETFIDWSRLDTISVKTYAFYNVGIKGMVLVYDRGTELDLGYDLLPDPIEMMKLLRTKVPEKMDKTFAPYVGEPSERRVVEKPIPMSPSGYNWALPMLLVVFMFIMTGTLFGIVHSLRGVLFMMIPVGLFSGMAYVFIRLSFSLEERGFRDRMQCKAEATAQGISVTRTPLGRIIRVTRPVVPWDEIACVRVKLDPMFYSNEAEFETVAGEKYWAPYRVYLSARENPTFSDDGYTATNGKTSPSRGPIVQTNRRNSALLIALMASSILIGPIVGGALFSMPEAYIDMAPAIALIVFVPLIIIGYWFIAQRNRASNPFFADDRGISMSNAPMNFTFIPRNEFIGASMQSDLIGLHIEINCAKGRVKVSQIVVEKLLAAGYPVANVPEKAYPAQGASPVSVPTPIPEKLGPGSMLLEEDHATMKAKVDKSRMIGLAFVAAGIAACVASAVLDDGAVCLTPLMRMMGVVFGLIFAALGILLVWIAAKTTPIRIYENGMAFPNPMAHGGVNFVPYGKMRAFSDIENPILGPSIQIHLDNNVNYFIPKSTQGFMEVFQQVKDRIGDRKYDCVEFEVFSSSAFWKYAILLYGITVGMGYAWAAMDLVGGTLTKGSVGTFLLMGSGVALAACAIATYFLGMGRRRLPFKGKLNVRAVAALIVVLSILFCAGLVMNEPSASTPEIFQDEAPSSSELSSGIVQNQIMTIDGNIHVPSGETLRIANSTITMGCTFNKEFSIYIEEGGRLEVVDSVITADYTAYGYGFEVHGSALFERADISRVCAPDGIENGDGGLELYSDNIALVDTAVHDNEKNGVMVVGCAPLFEGCTFRDNGDDALEICDSNPRITGCLFEENDYALVAFGDSFVTFEGNDVWNNSHGIFFESTVRHSVVGNDFKGNENYAVAAIDATEAEFEDNVFEGNGVDVDVRASLQGMCTTVYLLGFVVALVANVFLLRKAQEANVIQDKQH